MERITIKETDYRTLSTGDSRNGLADMIPSELEEMGYEIVVIDDFTGRVISRLS
jgi:hypothetical protein